MLGSTRYTRIIHVANSGFAHQFASCSFRKPRPCFAVAGKADRLRQAHHLLVLLPPNLKCLSTWFNETSSKSSLKRECGAKLLTLCFYCRENTPAEGGATYAALIKIHKGSDVATLLRKACARSIRIPICLSRLRFRQNLNFHLSSFNFASEFMTLAKITDGEGDTFSLLCSQERSDVENSKNAGVK